LLKILRFCGKKPPSSSSDLFVLGVHKCSGVSHLKCIKSRSLA
jgi:hypothetical protein